MWLNSPNTQRLVDELASDPDAQEMYRQLEDIAEVAVEMPEPVMNMTADGGYIVDFDTATVEAIVAEMADAAQFVEDLSANSNGDCEEWMTDAIDSVMRDPAFYNVRDKAYAFERKFAKPLSMLFNKLMQTNAQLVAAQDPAEMEAWMNSFGALIAVIEEEAQMPVDEAESVSEVSEESTEMESAWEDAGEPIGDEGSVDEMEPIVNDTTVEDLVAYEDGDDVIYEPMVNVTNGTVVIDIVPVPVDNTTEYNYTIVEPVPDVAPQPVDVNETIAEDIAEVMPEVVEEPVEIIDVEEVVAEIPLPANITEEEAAAIVDEFIAEAEAAVAAEEAAAEEAAVAEEVAADEAEATVDDLVVVADETA